MWNIRADWSAHNCHNRDQPSLNSLSSLNSPERQLRDNMNNNSNQEQQGYNTNNSEPSSYSNVPSTSFSNYQIHEPSVFAQSFEYEDGRRTKIENLDQVDPQKWDLLSRLNCLDNPDIWNSPVTMNTSEEGGQEKWNPLCQTPSLCEAILETDKYLVSIF